MEEKSGVVAGPSSAKGISEQDIDKYVKSDGTKCVKCKSTDLDRDPFIFYDEDTHKIYQDLTCLTCDYEWTEVWVLSSVTKSIPEKTTKEDESE